MTPNDAYHRMRDIARERKRDKERAYGEGVKVLCEIARKNGFYRAVEVFEDILKR